MSTQPPLGSILSAPQQRDAIHIAIAPVSSDEVLFPGQHVGLVPGSADKVSVAFAHIGIVDPFLNHKVMPGERFFVMLYIQTITSLRHEWTHPAFNPTAPKIVDPQEVSTAWIKSYAEGLGLDFEELMGAAAAWLRDEDYLCKGGDLEGVQTDPEFWNHYSLATSSFIPDDKRQNFFTCSC